MEPRPELPPQSDIPDDLKPGGPANGGLIDAVLILTEIVADLMIDVLSMPNIERARYDYMRRQYRLRDAQYILRRMTKGADDARIESWPVDKTTESVRSSEATGILQDQSGED